MKQNKNLCLWWEKSLSKCKNNSNETLLLPLSTAQRSKWVAFCTSPFPLSGQKARKVVCIGFTLYDNK